MYGYDYIVFAPVEINICKLQYQMRQLFSSQDMLLTFVVLVKIIL